MARGRYGYLQSTAYCQPDGGKGTLMGLLDMLQSCGTGPLAHLVERFHGMEEVRGSIPLGSTDVKKIAPAGYF